MISITIDNVTPLQMRQISDIMHSNHAPSSTPVRFDPPAPEQSAAKAFPALEQLPKAAESHEVINLETIAAEEPSKQAKYDAAEREASLRAIHDPSILPKAPFEAAATDEVIPSEELPTTATRKKGGKTGPSMPGFGRTTTQIETFVSAEANRTKDLDEEDEIRNQRREERAAIKAEKDAVQLEKQEEKELEENLIAEIKEADSAPKPTTLAVRKPWIL